MQSAQDKHEAIAAALRAGRPHAWIINNVGACSHAIMSVAKRYGVGRPGWPRLSAEQRERLRALLREGHSDRAAAQAVGCTAATARHWRAKERG